LPKTSLKEGFFRTYQSFLSSINSKWNIKLRKYLNEVQKFSYQ
jgi:hypothetical protein